LGITEGTLIRIENLSIHLDNMENVSGSIISITRIIPISSFGVWNQFSKSKLPTSLDSRTFQDHIICQSAHTINVRCSLASIAEISFDSRCSVCSSIICMNVCGQGCKDFEAIISATGKFDVEDGTIHLAAQTSSFQFISRLFRLNELEQVKLQDLTKSCGSFRFNYYSARRGDFEGTSEQIDSVRFLLHICRTKPWQRQLRVWGTISKTNRAFFEESPSCLKSSEMMRLRKVKLLDGSERTVVGINRIYFKATHLSEIDPILETNMLLQQLQ
jgi:hypothetical protein